MNTLNIIVNMQCLRRHYDVDRLPTQGPIVRQCSCRPDVNEQMVNQSAYERSNQQTRRTAIPPGGGQKQNSVTAYTYLHCDSKNSGPL